MQKILKIVLIVIGVIGAVLSFFFMPSGDDPEAINSGAIDLMFVLTWVLLIAAAALALFFGLKKMMTTPGGLKKALFALGGLAVIVAISYGLSSGDEAKSIADAMADKGATESTVKNIGMGLNVFFILTVVAVALMVWSGVKKIFVK
ncbi:hypothetical protein ACFSQJ_16830 [Croceitalea marina]|uniref:DUF4064 domain-containing protein n=1 Tax=Croceitalea marina TaxID=1775166 RepID=A0ABW5N0E5_9FLAO